MSNIKRPDYIEKEIIETKNKVDSVDKKIKQIVLYAEDFRENSTMTDDELLNKIIENGYLNDNISVLFERNKTYTFSDYIKIHRSNFTLDFNGANIQLNIPENPTVNKGAIYLYSENSTYTIDSFDLFYKHTTSNNHTFDTLSKIIVASDVYSQVNIGDVVGLEIRPSEPPYNSTETIPCVSTATKVVGKIDDENALLVDYYSPYDWTPYSTFTRKSIVLYTELIKNVTIKNIGKMTIGKSLSRFAPIMINGGENITIENCNFSEYTLPALYMQRVYNLNIKNIYCDKPFSVDNGLGYNTQLHGCNKVHVDNLSGDRLRHLVDVSGGYNILIENSYLHITSTTPSCFDCHGIGEHHITYRNCIGSWCFGNGRSQFPSCSDDISIENCVVKGLVGDADNMVNISNSTVFLSTDAIASKFRKITFNSSKINLTKGYQAHLRGIHSDKLDIQHTCTFNDCEFMCPNKTGEDSDNITLAFSYWNNVMFNKCTLDLNMSIVTNDTLLLSFCNCNLGDIAINSYSKNVIMDNCYINSVTGRFKLYYHKPSVYLKHVFKNNTFNLKNGTDFFKIGEDTTGATYKHYIIMENNIINVSGDSTGNITYSIPNGQNIIYKTHNILNSVSNGTVTGLYNTSLDTFFETL